MTHVMIVEDHEENRTLLKMLLEANGYRVTVAGDGVEALAAARRDPPDAIVSDVLMPTMDGFALCRHWMQDTGLKAVPFIFYSATYVHPEDEQFGLALGAVRYLIKPLEAEVFLRELRAVLRQWAGHAAPAPASPLDDTAVHALHESALARKIEDKIAQLEAANRKSRESEVQLKGILESTADGILAVDSKGKVIRANRRFAELWRIPRPLLDTGDDQALLDFVGSQLNDPEAFMNKVQALYASDAEDMGTLTFKDGRIFERHSAPLILDGAILGRVWSFRDITERNKSEKALELFRALIDQSNDAIEVVDPDTFRFLDVNQRACVDLGYSREELLSLSVFDVDRALDRSRITEMSGFFRKREFNVYEGRRWRKDGSEFPVEASVRYIRLDRDYLLSITRDITGRKQAERSLVDSEQRFRSLVEQSFIGIFIGDGERMLYANPRTEEILGYEPGGLAGTSMISLVATADRPAVEREHRRLMSGEATMAKLEFRMLRRDGSEVTVGAQGHRARVDDRSAVVGVLQDISEKKRTEEQVQRYVAQIENAFMSTVQVITILGEMRDPYTAGHQRRVGEIALAIGAELGFDARRQEGLRVAGYLHDVGKIRIPSEILSKPGKLSPIEFELVRGHAQASYDVLKDVKFPWPVAEVALQHHERMDGSGYPQGLKGEAILLEARIMAVADVIEAMSSHRPYRVGLGIEMALAEIERGRGSVYDAEVADVCLKLFREQRYQVPA